MAQKVCVVGAGFGGIRAALELAKKDVEVEIFDTGENHVYIPGLINLLRGRVGEDRLKLDLESFFAGTSVTYRNRCIEDIDLEQKLLLSDSHSYRYNQLVLATGSEVFNPGTDLEHAEDIYGLESARQAAENIELGDTAVVVGSGYVGVEAAGELHEKGLDVKVVDAATRPMSQSNDKSGRLALNYMNDKDIAFMGGRRVTEVDESSVEFEDGAEMEADHVFWSAGIQASELVQEVFDTDRAGLNVNHGLSSSEYESVFAVGDCADHNLKKTAHNAINQGQLAAENVTKSADEELEEYEEDRLPIVISLGKTGILHHGERAYKNVFFRYLKDMIRMRYWFHLKRKKWYLRVRNLF